MTSTCEHTTIYHAADSGVAPLAWTVRTHGAWDLGGAVLRAYLGQCLDCGTRFTRVQTWHPDQDQILISPWAVLPAPTGPATVVVDHPATVDLDDITRCPRGQWCETCGATTGLEVRTVGCALGVYCLTLCLMCSAPDESGGWAGAARRVLAHGEHLGIDLDQMASQLDRERGAQR